MEETQAKLHYSRCKRMRITSDPDGFAIDQQGHGNAPFVELAGNPCQIPYGAIHPYQSNNKMIADTVVTTGSIDQSHSQQISDYAAYQAQVAQNQLAHQQKMYYLQQKLQSFWAHQFQEIAQTTDFKNHSVSLARIKKIMKADEDVKKVATEASVIFAKACEMFILELTLRSWTLADENKRITLQKNDVAAAITQTEIFDFLVDFVTMDDPKAEGFASFLPRAKKDGVPPNGLPNY